MAIKLKVKERKVLGKKVKNLRKEGIIPAELFGPKIENKHLSVSYSDFIDVYKKAGKNTIIELDIENEKETVPTLVSDIQVHPIKREPLAIDFYMVSRDTKLETEVPITLTGEAPAEKEGLIIVQVLDEIGIESLPQDIPDEIEVDISNLESTQDKIYVKDLEVPEDIEIKTKENNAVVTVSEKEEEIVEEEPEVAPLTEELEDIGEEEEGPEIIEEKDETEEEEPKEE